MTTMEREYARIFRGMMIRAERLAPLPGFTHTEPSARPEIVAIIADVANVAEPQIAPVAGAKRVRRSRCRPRRRPRKKTRDASPRQGLWPDFPEPFEIGWYDDEPD